ncbi:hypothetical protein Lal_00012533 [Lupinus albus]|nr:hypothetical protein Lal_00012533 [Lupinus albus]
MHIEIILKLLGISIHIEKEIHVIDDTMPFIMYHMWKFYGRLKCKMLLAYTMDEVTWSKHLIKELIEKIIYVIMKTSHVNSKDQLVDILTKLLWGLR